MRKAGKVINIEKNKVHIVTMNKEFATIRRHSTEPIIGAPYAGEEFQGVAIWKYLLAATCIILLIFSGRRFYLDNRYNFSVIVDMNCSIKLEVTGSNKIKKAEGISSGGHKITELIDLDSKPLEEALRLILDESIKQKYLTKAHAEDGFPISIFISDNKNKTPVELPEFKKYAATQDFKILLNNDGQAIIE